MQINTQYSSLLNIKRSVKKLINYYLIAKYNSL
ncbi:hypothetical protein YPPY36_3698, partial [Yersinia pestis PY-36]